MNNNFKRYTAGYLAMLEKCAQFEYDPIGIDKPMYYSLDPADQERLDRRMRNINNAQRKYDDTHWYNPADWFKMMSYKWQEGHNERELNKEKRRIAARTANSDPVSYYEMKALRDYGGKRFVRVDPETLWDYKTTRDSILRSFDSRALLRYLTQNARDGAAMAPHVPGPHGIDYAKVKGRELMDWFSSLSPKVQNWLLQNFGVQQFTSPNT